MPKKKCRHKPKSEKLGYLQWHAWAEKMTAQGKTQILCPVCKKWFFKSEM